MNVFCPLLNDEWTKVIESNKTLTVFHSLSDNYPALSIKDKAGKAIFKGGKLFEKLVILSQNEYSK